MQRLEVSLAVRHLYGSLGVKGLKHIFCSINIIMLNGVYCVDIVRKRGDLSW